MTGSSTREIKCEILGKCQIRRGIVHGVALVGRILMILDPEGIARPLEAEAARPHQAHAPIVVEGADQDDRPIAHVFEGGGAFAADVIGLALRLEKTGQPAERHHIGKGDVLAAQIIKLEEGGLGRRRVRGAGGGRLRLGGGKAGERPLSDAQKDGAGGFQTGLQSRSSAECAAQGLSQAPRITRATAVSGTAHRNVSCFQWRLDGIRRRELEGAATVSRAVG